MRLLTRNRALGLAAFGLFVVGLLAAEPAAARHDVFVRIAVGLPAGADPAPRLPRIAEPIQVGVPIPRVAELRRLDGLVLVGARACQLRTLERWPDGSIQWLLVDAQVDVAANGRTSDLYLTTGASNADGPLLASPAGEGWRADTGSARFTLQPAGPLLGILERDGAQRALAARLELAGHPGPATAWSLELEENGPLRATLLRRCRLPLGAGRSLEASLRIGLSRGSAQLRLRLAWCLRGSVADSPTPELVLPLAARDAASSLAWASGGRGGSGHLEPGAAWNSEAAPGGETPAELAYLETGGTRLLLRTRPDIPTPRFASGDGTLRIRLATRASGARLGEPGARALRELLWDLDPTGPAEAAAWRWQRPLRAGAELAVYQDGGVLRERLVPLPTATPAPPAASDTWKQVRRDLYDSIRSPAPALWLGRAEAGLWAQLESGPSAPELPGEAPGMWVRLRGDALAREAYLEWGRAWRETLREREPADLPEAILQLLDLARSAGEASWREEAWTRCADRWDGPAPPGAGRTAEGRPRLALAELAAWGQALAALVEQGGLEEARADRARDWLEAIARRASEALWTPQGWRSTQVLGEPASPTGSTEQSPAALRLLTWGFLLSGERAFLRQGEALLSGSSEADLPLPTQGLVDLLARPERRRVWRELPLELQREGGGARLRWTVPREALRLRLQQVAAGQPFWAGSPLADVPLGPPGSAQEHRLVKLPAESTVLARYLAGGSLDRGRGERLATPAEQGSFVVRPSASASPPPSPPPPAPPLPWGLMGVLLAGVAACAWLVLRGARPA